MMHAPSLEFTAVQQQGVFATLNFAPAAGLPPACSALGIFCMEVWLHTKSVRCREVLVEGCSNENQLHYSHLMILFGLHSRTPPVADVSVRTHRKERTDLLNLPVVLLQRERYLA